MFFVAEGIFLYKAVCRPDNMRVGAEIVLHQQHLCARMLRLKGQERLGICRAEAVNALILISDHEQVLRLRCKQRDNCVLDLRGILCLIDTDIRIFFLKIRQQPRDPAKHLIGIDHLVIIVHEMSFPQPCAVFPVHLRDGKACLLVQLPDLFLIEHHVLNVSNQGTDIFQIALRRVLPLHTAVNFRQYFRRDLLVSCQLKGRFSCAFSIILQDSRADAVDCPKLEPPRQILSEICCAASGHIAGRRDRVGDSQNVFRRDSPAIDHIAESGDKDGGLARSGYSKKQYRSVHALYCFLLLCI